MASLSDLRIIHEMHLDEKEKYVYCEKCSRWLNLNMEILVLDDIDVVCMHCFPYQYAHLGYIWDISKWKE